MRRPVPLHLSLALFPSLSLSLSLCFAPFASRFYGFFVDGHYQCYGSLRYVSRYTAGRGSWDLSTLPEEIAFNVPHREPQAAGRERTARWGARRTRSETVAPATMMPSR